jgi:hypothetical protein
MRVDVSELITDPDFASTYTVIRRTGKWVNGRFKINDPPERLSYYGTVQPATTRDIEQMNIGDDEKGVMKFFCRQPKDIYLTHNFNEYGEDDDHIQVSDEIEFRGLVYKVLQISPWQHAGWTRAFAALKGAVG